MPPVVEIPPGVDLERFHPLTPAARRRPEPSLGLPVDGPLVVSVSRLVPRKGMDVLIDASAALGAVVPDLTVAIAGAGRDRGRLAARVAGQRRAGAPARRVRDDDLPCSLRRGRRVRHGLPRPLARASSRRGSASSSWRPPPPGCPRWPGAAAAPTRPSRRRDRSWSSTTRPTPAAGRALRRLLTDDELRRQMGPAARHRAEASFDYDILAPRLAAALPDVEG